MENFSVQDLEEINTLGRVIGNLNQKIATQVKQMTELGLGGENWLELETQ